MVRESGRLAETSRKSSPNDVDRGLLEYPPGKVRLPLRANDNRDLFY